MTQISPPTLSDEPDVDSILCTLTRKCKYPPASCLDGFPSARSYVNTTGDVRAQDAEFMDSVVYSPMRLNCDVRGPSLRVC